MGSYPLARTFFCPCMDIFCPRTDIFFMYVVFKSYTTLYDFWNISLWSRDNYATTTTKNPKSEPPKKKAKTQSGVKKGQKEQIMPKSSPAPTNHKEETYEKMYRKMILKTSFDEELLERLVTQCPLFLEPRGHLVGAGWTPTKVVGDPPYPGQEQWVTYHHTRDMIGNSGTQFRVQGIWSNLGVRYWISTDRLAISKKKANRDDGASSQAHGINIVETRQNRFGLISLSSSGHVVKYSIATLSHTNAHHHACQHCPSSLIISSFVSSCQFIIPHH